MYSENIPFTVQLGHSASVQLADAVINTGSSGATFNLAVWTFPPLSLELQPRPVQCHLFEVCPIGPHHDKRSARRAHQPMLHSISTSETSKKRASVFARLSYDETPTMKQVVTGRHVTAAPVPSVAFPSGPFTPGRHDTEASSSGGKPSRRQRRNRNAELRAQGLLSNHHTPVKNSNRW